LKGRFIYVVYLVLLAGLVFFLNACSQEKNTLVSKGWHNLNARDNAYFLARERTKELENEIDAKTQSNYNKVLFPVTIIDTNQTKAYKDKTDDIVKKASLPITNHKNSEYVDNSYILVGKSRILRGEWKLAAETFKFVNAQGGDEERFESLTQLMRLFMLKKDFRSAGYVMDYLDKQPIKLKRNIRDFALTKAQYSRYQENYAPMVTNIETAVPLVTGKKEKKARLYFILGQVYQFQGKDSMAYINYRKAIKNNPSYELSFYSKLYLAQVTSLSNASDKKKTERYFKRLLKDKKNLDYKDKIYYEMALFEYKQKKVPQAISYLEKSVYENRGNKYQKGATYLKLAQIYYGDLKNFEQAKLYYDSTVAVWDKDDPQYKEIVGRQKILAEFVTNLLVVRREDSLQRLAKMDTAALAKFIDKVIADEEAARIKKEKQAAAAKKRAADILAGPQIIDNNLNPADPSSWYFYNPTAIARGATDFKVKWGNRKLEDNWRRSVKEAPQNAAEEAPNPDSAATTAGTKNKNTVDTVAKSKKPVVDKSQYYRDIPYTAAQLAASHKKIQEALYNLGRIYNLKLNEPEFAIKTFEDLLKRYPNYENAAEILYFLHLINKDQKNTERAEYYKNKLINEYPKSIYAKMLLNPNYLKESKEENRYVATLYKQAFQTYERNDFIAADSMLVSIMKAHPDNDIMDRMKLLRIIITGRTKNALVYKEQLQAFIGDKDNEMSPVLPKAKELLATSDAYLQALNSKGGEVKESDVRYSTVTSKPHYFVAVFESKKAKKEVMLKQLENYNKHYPDLDLKVEIMKVSDTSFALVVKTFEAMYPSKQYRENVMKPGAIAGRFESIVTYTFYITDDNYKLFYKDKNVNTYLEFFKNNY
jgi:tetratricopeptide (TPR) repeat protein